MTKPTVTSFLVAQKIMKKRIDTIEKLNLNFDQGSTDHPCDALWRVEDFGMHLQ